MTNNLRQTKKNDADNDKTQIATQQPISNNSFLIHNLQNWYH